MGPEGINIGDIFVDKKHKFLMYAPFITQCQNITSLIEEMKKDLNVKDGVEKLEMFMQSEMHRRRDGGLPGTLKNLLCLPFQHILR